MVGIDVVDGEVAVGLVNVCSEKVLRWVNRNTKQLRCGLTKLVTCTSVRLESILWSGHENPFIACTVTWCQAVG